MRMNDQDILKSIKERTSAILRKNDIDYFRIYLFGSRATGLEREDSDFDILIVVDKEIGARKKFRLRGDILYELFDFDYAFDIIIKTESDFREEKEITGTLVHSIGQYAQAL
jgi:predicted nucleotidyltransferase